MLVFDPVAFGGGRLRGRRAWCLVVHTYGRVHSDHAGATVTLQALVALHYKLFPAIWRFGMSSADDTIQRDPDVYDSEATLWVLLTSTVEEESAPAPSAM